MSLDKTILLALKDKNPALHRQLAKEGTLKAFVTDLAEQINEQIVTLTMELAGNKGVFREPFPDPLEKVGILNQARSLATETVLAEMLEFPQDETSPQRPAATTLSATAT